MDEARKSDDGSVDLPIDLEKDLIFAYNNPGCRTNDGKCDINGNIWVGTMSQNHPFDSKHGNFYVLKKNDQGEITSKIQIPGTIISNGLSWDQSKKLFYYTDTPLGNVRSFDWNEETCEISNGKEIIKVQVENGGPDGHCIDGEGKLWIAEWNGSRVRRWDPNTGECIYEIKVPSLQITSCCFGGKNLDELYITSAYDGLSDEVRNKEESKECGAIFKVTGLNIPGGKTYQCKI